MRWLRSCLRGRRIKPFIGPRDCPHKNVDYAFYPLIGEGSECRDCGATW